MPRPDELVMQKRSFYLSDPRRRSSILLEPVFWHLLERRAESDDRSWQQLLTELHQRCPEDIRNFSSWLRVTLVQDELRQARD